MENVHTYAHARRVLNAPRCTKMHQQTFQWPTSTPPTSYPDYVHNFSPFGPPVRHVEDLIACHYLSIHRPDVFKLRTSDVLDSVSDRDFDAYELRKKEEAARRFQQRFSSYTSSFDREVDKLRSNGNKKQKKKPKRSKFFDDLTSSASDTWHEKGIQRLEHVNIQYAEEIILPPSCESVVEYTITPPKLHYATVSILPQPQRAIITVEEKDEFQEQTSPCQRECNDHRSKPVVKAVRWSKRTSTRSYSPSVRRSLKEKGYQPCGVKHGKYHRLCCSIKHNIKFEPILIGSLEFIRNHVRVIELSPFISIQRDYKKRRRKCESEHAH